MIPPDLRDSKRIYPHYAKKRFQSSNPFPNQGSNNTQSTIHQASLVLIIQLVDDAIG